MVLDAFDYKEPSCVSCGGKEFYYPHSDEQTGSIPVRNIIEKLDGCFETNDLVGAERLLDYWYSEAEAMNDKRGLLAILSEQMGLYRKTNNKEKGLESSYRGLDLLKELNLLDAVSGATIALNAATTLKAFGKSTESIPIYKEVQTVYENKLSADDKKIAGLLNNMALAYVDAGEYSEAEKNYKRAITVLSKNTNTENEIAITYINMAHLYRNEYGESEQKIYDCMEKAWEYLSSEKIKKNGYHAFVCEKCAPSFEFFGYFVYADDLKGRIKEIYERT